MIKACYGLVTAPARWYQCIDRNLKELGMEQCKSDPCLWVFRQIDASGTQQTVGYIASHVDDFLISGDEECEAWAHLLQQFYSRFRWSPWECQSYLHCGIKIREEVDFSFSLDHTSFCEGIQLYQIHSSSRSRNSD